MRKLPPRYSFDSISHATRLNKLPFLGTSRNTQNWFQSYLIDREKNHSYRNIHIYKAKSNSWLVILGPVLFSLHNELIPHRSRKENKTKQKQHHHRHRHHQQKFMLFGTRKLSAKLRDIITH